jgi:hypothetical protein
VFGFLIGGEVNDEAVALTKLTDLAVNRYSALKREQLVEAIERDFDQDHRYIGASEINFVYPELEHFQFGFDQSINLTVIGRGRYAGFMLNVIDSSRACSVSDGIAYRATGGAKKLVKVLVKKFGLTDTSELLKELW